MNKKINVKNKIIYAFSVIFLLIVSCASAVYSFKETDQAAEKSDFQTAIDIIRKEQNISGSFYKDNNSLSFMLDMGFLENYAGNYALSSAELSNAEKLIEEAYTNNISQSFSTYIVNENYRDYYGEDFENIYLNIFNALNYYHTGKIDSAIMEIQKIIAPNGKLNTLGRKYNYTDPITGSNLKVTAQTQTGVSQFPQTKDVNFSNSALARYLGALFYQAAGNADLGRAEFDQIQTAFSANKDVYHFPIPSAVRQSRNVPSGQARLNIIGFTGLSPIKEEKIVLQYLPFRHPILQIASFRLPGLARRQSVITEIEIIINDSEKFKLELLEDMSAVVEEIFSAHYANILLKTYIRSIIKYAVADIAAIETGRQNNELAGVAVAVAARAALHQSESVDTRMSRYLPGKAYVGGINLSPGVYSVTINYLNGETIVGSEFKEVRINANRLNLLQTVNLK